MIVFGCINQSSIVRFYQGDMKHRTTSEQYSDASIARPDLAVRAFNIVKLEYFELLNADHVLRLSKARPPRSIRWLRTSALPLCSHLFNDGRPGDARSRGRSGEVPGTAGCFGLCADVTRSFKHIYLPVSAPFPAAPPRRGRGLFGG